MSKLIRTFVAVKIAAPASLRKVISRLARMDRSIKESDPQSLHITLKFLGDTPPQAIPTIAATVAELAESTPAFSVRLLGIGAFPTKERPSVVWAGLQQADPLLQLVGGIEDRLQPLGFPKEHRDFRPHLTLARVKSRPPADLFQLFEEHGETDFGVTLLAGVEVLQSELRPQGPAYTVLARSNFPDG